MQRNRRATKNKAGQQPSRPVSAKRILGIAGIGLIVAIPIWLAVRPLDDDLASGPGSPIGTPGLPPIVWNDDPLLPAVALGATPHEMADEAQQVLDRLLTKFPDVAAAHGVAGHIYSLFGRSDEAIGAWQRSLELDPNFAQGYRYLGSQRMEDGDFAEAARLLREGYDLEPRFPGIANQLADALLHSGQMEPAKQVLKESQLAGTSTPGFHFLLGQVALQMREFAESHRELSLAVEEDPSDANAIYSLATACLRLGNRIEAADWMKKFKSLKEAETAEGVVAMRAREDARRVRSYLATTYREAGNLYGRQQQFTAAESHWLYAAAWAPGDIEVRITLGRYYQEQRELVKLAKVQQQLTEIDPSNPAYFLELGRVLRDAGRFDSSEAALLRCCELAPQRPEGYRALALLYVNSPDKHRAAIEFAQRAVELEASARNYFVLAVAYQTSGELPAAIDAARRATQLEPQHAGYRDAYESLRNSE